VIKEATAGGEERRRWQERHQRKRRKAHTPVRRGSKRGGSNSTSEYEKGSQKKDAPGEVERFGESFTGANRRGLRIEETLGGVRLEEKDALSAKTLPKKWLDESGGTNKDRLNGKKEEKERLRRGTQRLDDGPLLAEYFRKKMIRKGGKGKGKDQIVFKSVKKKGTPPSGAKKHLQRNTCKGTNPSGKGGGGLQTQPRGGKKKALSPLLGGTTNKKRLLGGDISGGRKGSNPGERKCSSQGKKKGGGSVKAPGEGTKEKKKGAFPVLSKRGNELAAPYSEGLE